MSVSSPTHDALVRLPKVLARVPISRASWLKGVKEGRYPAPVKIGEKVTAWRVSDIDKVVNGQWGTAA